MAELDSALDGLATDDLGVPAPVAGPTAELVRARNRIDAELARPSAAPTSRRPPITTGWPMASWLAGTAPLPGRFAVVRRLPPSSYRRWPRAAPRDCHRRPDLGARPATGHPRTGQGRRARHRPHRGRRRPGQVATTGQHDDLRQVVHHYLPG